MVVGVSFFFFGGEDSGSHLVVPLLHQSVGQGWDQNSRFAPREIKTIAILGKALVISTGVNSQTGTRARLDKDAIIVPAVLNQTELVVKREIYFSKTGVARDPWSHPV